MHVPDPKVVRHLLTRYATLRIAQAERHSPALARELDDVTDALRAMTGASSVHEAVERADDLLAGGGRSPEGDGESGLSLAV
ncbi:DUF5133 domain-containing protein [Streptomyces sp. NPDC005908]|uniref:DUF5133 domain-containing protein n=1 Tax=Streptomyces tendae TaxID=1932 RepID=A0ABX5ZSE5_STRTE|nr:MULTISPECIES: DUF5133 domain-containing protein [Streptomyces]QER87373.1 DUF5133 domain-containing protein [Streptomyces tendae]TWD29446.1 uncharacterized protein DUF5133 [Streptomyces sp. T12]